MSMNRKTKKRAIILSIVLVVIAALLTGIYFFIQYQNDQKTVEVVPVSQISTSYWADESTTDGTVSSDYIQELYPQPDRTVSEIFVQEGDTVSIGDTLLQYDKTKLELDVKVKKSELDKAELNVQTAQKELKKLQNTKPYVTPKPVVPTPTPTRKPVIIPTPTPTSSPSPSIPPATVTLYSRLDLNSVPYAGSGTSDDPYVFLCTEDCTMTSEFLLWLLGSGATPVPTPLPTPSPEDGDGEEETPSEEGEESSELVPTPTPWPASQLVSPFAAVFEVREGDSNFGALISAFKLDGTQLSANFQITDTITGSNTIGSVADLFGATPTPAPNNYNHMNYTAAELQQLITDKKQEIRNLQYQRDQARIDLDRANLALKNSTVLSTIDGVVKTLMDVDAAAASNSPFLVVSGDQRYYVTGVLSESMLGSVQIGDTITANSWDTGQTYTAEIVSIADYPVDTSNGYYYNGVGNPNSSYYQFSAVLDGGEDLQNGAYLQLTINVETVQNSDALYVWKPYLKDDDGGTYVMMVGADDRLTKQYLQIGKAIYSGEYYEVISGLTLEDYVAFPNTDAKAGMRVRLEGSDEIFSLGGSSGADTSLPEDGGNIVPEGDVPSEENGVLIPPDEDNSDGFEEGDASAAGSSEEILYGNEEESGVAEG